MHLTIFQIKKLADYTLDVSKGMLVAGLSAPVIISTIELVTLLRILILSIFLLIYSLEWVKMTEIEM